jgi:S1-C subfamily serine protease
MKPETDSEEYQASDSKQPTKATITFLSGPNRGKSVHLSGKNIHIDEHKHHVLVIKSADESSTPDHIATFHRSGKSYELVAKNQRAEWPVWVNGERINNCLLESGDIIEVSNCGPVMIFRTGLEIRKSYKSLKNVYLDCIHDSRIETDPPLKKGVRFLTHFVADLSIQTSVWFRVIVLLILLILAVAILSAIFFSRNIEQRLAEEQSQISGLVDLLYEAESQSIKREELARMRDEISKGISTTVERVEALETRSAAAQQIIAKFTKSVIFIQGEYGYQDPDSGQPLRLMIDEEGNPMRSLFGRPAVTMEGKGPPLKVDFSGTAFSVSDQGYMLTNRHLVLPWEDHPANPGMLELGLEPVVQKLLGYVADDVKPLELQLVRVSEEVDIALIQTSSPSRLGPPLALSPRQPRPGEEIVLLGYPAGVHALLARASDEFIDQLKIRTDFDVWQLVQELANHRLIQPLASRGIVAQVTDDIVAYDAETARGGSGSPVLLLTGEVAAINSAILSDFGGSNIGVPVKFAQMLLDQN